MGDERRGDDLARKIVSEEGFDEFRVLFGKELPHAGGTAKIRALGDECVFWSCAIFFCRWIENSEETKLACIKAQLPHLRACIGPIDAAREVFCPPSIAHAERVIFFAHDDPTRSGNGNISTTYASDFCSIIVVEGFFDKAGVRNIAAASDLLEAACEGRHTPCFFLRIILRSKSEKMLGRQDFAVSACIFERHSRIFHAENQSVIAIGDRTDGADGLGQATLQCHIGARGIRVRTRRFAF